MRRRHQGDVKCLTMADGRTMDVIQCILVVVSVIVLTRASSLPDGLSIKSAVKRSAPEQPIGIFDSDYDAVDKRMRYGKRSSYDDYFDDGDDLDKRATFRFGKRDEMNEDDVKRLFRLVLYSNPNVAGETGIDDTDKRKVFRYGKRNSWNLDAQKRTLFPFVKRPYYSDIYNKVNLVSSPVQTGFLFGGE